MKALVTGGAGFIGSNIVELLLRSGHSVRVIDNLSSGHIDNLKGFDVEFIQADICDMEAVFHACSGCDVIFHLAASVGRQRSLDKPHLDSQTNVIGTINVLEGMRKQKVPKIIYSSSAAIFGELQMPKIAEDHPQNADSPYGVSKLAAEKMILAYSGIYGITGICLRYFNIYGVNQRYDLYGNVIPIFAKRLFSDESIIIYGDGNQTRDFLNVKDVAAANYLAALSNSQTNVYNLGSGSSITINELASMMKRLAGKDAIIEYKPERPADVRHCKADIDKVKNDLKFSASIVLSDGLKQYIDWYKTCV